MAIWSLRGLIVLWCDKYGLWVLQEAAVGGCNGGSVGYNIGGYNGSSGYNIGSYTIVVHSSLYKQLCLDYILGPFCKYLTTQGLSVNLIVSKFYQIPKT